MKKYFALSILFLISACGSLEKKTSTGSVTVKNPTQLSHIPQNCLEPKKQFRPIKTILSKSSYNVKAQTYHPIIDSKGFISTDFNQDGKADFHFLERYKNDIRLISCLSSRKKYQRRPTPFNVHETIGADFQTIYEVIRSKGKILTLIVNRHEHNWGSDSEVSHYVYDKKSRSFLMTEQEITSSSGDGLRSDTVERYDLEKKRYQRSSTCGSMEEGCKPRKESGRIVLPRQPATLIKPKKVYSQLIKDK